MAIVSADGAVAAANDAFLTSLGRLRGDPPPARLALADGSDFRPARWSPNGLDMVAAGAQNLRIAGVFDLGDGNYLVRMRRPESGAVAELALRQGGILELVAEGAPIGRVMAALARSIDLMSPDYATSIRIVVADGNTERVAGDRLPAGFAGATRRLPPLDATALDRWRVAGQVYAIVDLVDHPQFGGHHAELAAHGFASVWFRYVLDVDGRVIGIISVLSRRRGLPTPDEVTALNLASHLAAVAIRHQRARDAAEASEARFREIAEFTNDWLWETDADLRVVHLSERFFETTGLEPELYYGRPTRENVHPAGTEAERARQIDDIRARRPLRNILVYVDRPDGGRAFYRVSGRPMLDEAGAFVGYRGGATDVTDRIQAERQLAEAKEAAERASRAKSEFLAAMSHELRTPLNAVLGFAEVLSGEMFGPLGNPRYREYARDIYDSGRHLLQLISDVLDLARLEAGRLELQEGEIEVPELIDEVQHMVRQQAEKAGLEMTTSIDPAVPPIRADRRRIKQVLLNLLSNSIKFTEAGGRIDILVESEPETGGLVLSVRDTGIGIAADDIPRALNLFGQIEGALARRHEGTGLGLPLSRALAELHGGSMELASAPGKGTRVSILLPRERMLRPWPNRGGKPAIRQLGGH